MKNFILTSFFLFKSILIISIIIFICSQNDKEQPCTLDDITYTLTECVNNKTNIIFNYKNPCLINSKSHILLPISIINAQCISCEIGEYISYNLNKNKLECSKCEINTYSTSNNIFVRSIYREWENDYIQSIIKNDCYYKDFTSDNEYKDCNPFIISSDGKYIHNNNINSLSNYEYKTILSIQITVPNQGQIYFKYSKDTIKYKSNILGIFRFYINYLIDYEDYNISNNTNWIEVNKTLSRGKYRLIWEYSLKTLLEKSKELQIKISDIIINGVETDNTKCRKCKKGSKNIGSDHCDICNEGEYLVDENSFECNKCPDGTYSNYGSVGIESCFTVANCTIDDYILVDTGKCNITNNKKIINFILKNDSNCKEVNKDILILKNEWYCDKCLIGQYIKIIDRIGKCEYCPEGYYSNNQDGICKKCGNITNKIEYIIPGNKTHYQNSNIEIINSEGELIAYLHPYKDKNNDNQILILVDGKYYKYNKLNLSYSINLSIGKHNINIQTIGYSIEKIVLKNSINGGGYNCTECINGYIQLENNIKICKICDKGYYLHDNKECLLCPINTYKYDNNENTCKKCPLFTYSNEERTSCLLSEVIENKNSLIKFVPKKYEELQERICLLNNNCFNSFYGPINELNNTNVFYISFNKSTYFTNNNYFIESDNIDNENAFIFLLRNKYDLIKEKIILGREIEFIKIITSKNNSGLIIKYSNGDVCKNNASINYTSFLFLKCNKDAKLKDIPVIKSSSNCSYFFEWQSKYGCRLCKKKEVSIKKSLCLNNKRNFTISEGDKCIIDYNSSYVNYVFSDKNDSFYSNDIDNIFYIYNISLDNNSNINDKFLNESYALIQKREEKCTFYQDLFYDYTILYYITSFFLLYFIAFILGCIFYFEYRTIKNKLNCFKFPRKYIDLRKNNIENFEEKKKKRNEEEELKRMKNEEDKEDEIIDI